MRWKAEIFQTYVRDHTKQRESFEISKMLYRRSEMGDGKYSL
jgi:hypothetical protein